ncbi:MAG: phytanoyl-CoA dioxygenase family protein [Planctomycetota bacterium]|nr:phytanoyl-CoA dioxygenase family protein [Planctomycetota bacterium]
MPFEFRDEMIHRYRSDGYVIFRQILPPSLIRDLRKAAARVPEIARGKSGPQAQRLQPIASHLTAEEMKPFLDYATFPPLVEAIQRILTPRHTLSNGKADRMALLLEPVEKPWWTGWHRDIREDGDRATAMPDLEEFRRITVDPLWFNQINCPLYEDNCTWYVPGSYLRRFDLPGEKAAAEHPMPGETATDEERERAGVEYCQRMPSSIRASMDAGDFMIYHPNGWHLGNYLPGRKRVTLHDWAPTPELVDWYDRWSKARAAAANK